MGKIEDLKQELVSKNCRFPIYLDNQASIGPDSRAGNNGARGLNENLAREVLELHTLGVDGGYTQDDVTAFARILTGWIYTDPANDDLYGGRYSQCRR